MKSVILAYENHYFSKNFFNVFSNSVIALVFEKSVLPSIDNDCNKSVFAKIFFADESVIFIPHAFEKSAKIP